MLPLRHQSCFSGNEGRVSCARKRVLVTEDGKLFTLLRDDLKKQHLSPSTASRPPPERGLPLLLSLRSLALTQRESLGRLILLGGDPTPVLRVEGRGRSAGHQGSGDKHGQKAESVRVCPASPPPPRPPEALQPALSVFRSRRPGPHGHCRGARLLGLHRQELREKYSWHIRCLGQNLGGTRLL